MVIMLQGFSTEEQRSVVRVLWAKWLNAKVIHKELFPVCGAKCLSRKAVQSWVEKFSKELSKASDAARPGAEVAETTDKRFLCCWFRRTGKAMGQVYRCWWRICRETGSNITFCVLYPFVTYLPA
jgi:hypothetical protein